jgi:PPOX class probable F420-dependent enzyme
MNLTDAQRAFIEQNRSAAMITLRRDGTPHAVRVGVGFLDGRLLSSSTRARVRTRHLRRDPRSTLFIFDGAWQWLTLECRVNIIDNDDVPRQSVRFFRLIQPSRPDGNLMWFGRAVTEAEMLQIMVEEGRIFYEFEPLRAYGMFGTPPTSV